MPLFWYPIFLCVAAISVVHAEDVPLFTDDPAIPWHIQADELAYDQKTRVYTAEGNVVISKQNRRLTADRVEFDHHAMKAVAEGHVMLTAGDDVLTGTRIETDLKTETGTVYDGSVFFSKNHFYLKGNTIQKTAANTYTADQALFTACDSSHPAWVISARNLSVTIEGYGTARHATFRVKDIPVFYSPFLVFPVKLKRQSGLLIPRFGYSDRKGAEYLQPIYWAISDQSDATFYEHVMQQRGNKIGAEFRYIVSEQTQGMIMADGLWDRKTDDGTPASGERWGYLYDGYARPNSDRWWLRMKHDQSLPYQFSAAIDVDIVSDQDYLTEFKSGQTGFETTNAAFNQTFGRELDDYTDPVRLNRLNIKRLWETSALNADVRWYANSLNRRQEVDTTVHQLPVVQYAMLKQPIPQTPFYGKINAEYAYFYRQDGAKTHRTDLYPKITAPYGVKNWLIIEPFIGVRETVWSIHDEDSTTASTTHRTLPDVGAELSTELSRQFKTFRHTIKPQLTYEYIPAHDSKDIPMGDAIDHLSGKNRITASVVNFLTSASSTFGRFKLEQPYDIHDAPSYDPTGRRGFAPMYGELELLMSDSLSVMADARWDHNTGAFLSRNMAVNLQNRRGDSLFAEHRYLRDVSESVYARLNMRISDAITGYAEYERNLHDDKDIRNGGGVEFASQCWSLNIRYAKEAGDHEIEFMVNLYGLAGL